jgi:uncharacterized protein YeaO (DUF488 family)
MTVAIKRVYELAVRKDGMRLLVDRLWPRGLSKADARIDEWLRDLAPSDSLRRAYHAETDTWSAFRSKYLKELSRPESEAALRHLYQLADSRKRLTLLYASKNETQNNAVVLKELLDGRRKPPTGTDGGAVSPRRKRSAVAKRT